MVTGVTHDKFTPDFKQPDNGPAGSGGLNSSD